MRYSLALKLTTQLECPRTTLHLPRSVELSRPERTAYETFRKELALRFANGIFEPIWNRNFIDHVQIDIPETLGLGLRSGFYESTGAYKDMVVTHLLQVLALVEEAEKDPFEHEAEQRKRQAPRISLITN